MTDRASLPQPVGTPGLTQWSGYISEEWDRRLRGTRGPKTYREMAFVVSRKGTECKRRS